jgi:lipid-binding SYLF domain-containing protein
MRALPFLTAFAAALCLAGAAPGAAAASAMEIETRADAAIERLADAAPEARELMRKATGVLVFPRVIKVGIGVGGEYGEGVLRVNGESVQYYSTASGSFGFQFGAVAKAQFILFMTEQALADFRAAKGWEVGVDGSVTLVKIGTGGSIDTTSGRDPVIGFVLADRGLMYDLSLAGTKITRIERD